MAKQKTETFDAANSWAGKDPRGDMFSGMGEDDLKKSLENHNPDGMAYYNDIKNAIEDTNPEMPIALIYAIIEAESDFNPNARSAAGAKGLMQFMPSNYGEKGGRYKHNPTNPSESIQNGVKFINDLLDGRYAPPAGDISKSLWGYNVGQNTKALKTKTFDQLPHGGGKYKSGGKTYVNKILSSYEKITGLNSEDSFPAESSKEDGRVKIAFIGDSNANVMARRYMKDEDNEDKNLRNFSRGGWGVDLAGKSWLKTLKLYKDALSSDEVKGFGPEAAIAKRLLKFKPDVITVLNLGGNDVGVFKKNPDAYKEKAKELMQLVDEFGGSYIGAAAVPASLKTRIALNEALEEVAEGVVKFYNPTKDIPYETGEYEWSNIGDPVHMGHHEAEEEYKKRQDAGLSKFDASKKRKTSQRIEIPKDLLEAGTPTDVLKVAAKIMIEGVRESVFKQWVESTKGDPDYTYISAYKGNIDSDTVIKDFKNIYNFVQTGKWSGDAISPETTPVAYDFVKVQQDARAAANKQNSPLEEINKGNSKMQITRERLAQIIKEEVEAYKASQLNEVDVDELEEAEAYIKEIADLLKSTYETFFRGAAPAVGTPQTKADTGEPVTDQTAHEDAKGLLLDLLGDAIDEFQQKEPQLNEDGHDDVPSAVRAMKTIIEDAGQMLQALEQMDGSLPTWWTNKMAVSASMLNKMRDYLLVPSLEEKLKPSMGAGAYVDDFRKSKAPQFKGKSDKKKQQMAIAAYLDAKDSGKA